MSRIKYEAAKLLAQSLALEPALEKDGVVKALQQPPDRLYDTPTVVVLPQDFKLIPWSPEEVPDEDGEPIMAGDDEGMALLEVGTLSGSVQLWCEATFPAVREQLEDAVINAFNREDFAPGRLQVSLTDIEVCGVATEATWPVAFLLEEANWREELAVSERRRSFLDVQVDLPVFVLRKEAHKVRQMVVALSQDLSIEVTTPTDLANVADLEQVLVNDDGSLSAYPPPP